jgi:hypothetical protein
MQTFCTILYYIEESYGNTSSYIYASPSEGRHCTMSNIYKDFVRGENSDAVVLPSSRIVTFDDVDISGNDRSQYMFEYK